MNKKIIPNLDKNINMKEYAKMSFRTLDPRIPVDSTTYKIMNWFQGWEIPESDVPVARGFKKRNLSKQLSQQKARAAQSIKIKEIEDDVKKYKSRLINDSVQCVAYSSSKLNKKSTEIKKADS